MAITEVTRTAQEEAISKWHLAGRAIGNWHLAISHGKTNHQPSAPPRFRGENGGRR